MSGNLFGEPDSGYVPPTPARDAPLAERMRPRSLDELVGQRHLVEEGGVLRQVLEHGLAQSLILWGPPGTGKTTLARMIAESSELRFQPFSAVLSGIPDIRRVMKEAAEARARTSERTLLFVDEIHRFNKAQQDAFLPFVEAGDVLLVGATTENPSFELNSALLSRARVLVLRGIEEPDLVALLRRALEDTERGLGGALIAVDRALEEIARAADGDARRALTLLETAALLAGKGGEVTPKVLAEALQRKHVRYDKSGEEHYNLISALHKSVRNSNPDAALYWLVRMLEGGEDRDFLLRRITRMAVEDIGLGDPDATAACHAAWETWRRLGSPEGELAIAQAVVRLAKAPKSNALYTAYKQAQADVQESTNEPVPLHLCNAPTGLMKELGYAKGYRYAHDDPQAAQEMECFPPSLAGRRYLEPNPDKPDPEQAGRGSLVLVGVLAAVALLIAWLLRDAVGTGMDDVAKPFAVANESPAPDAKLSSSSDTSPSQREDARAAAEGAASQAVIARTRREPPSDLLWHVAGTLLTPNREPLGRRVLTGEFELQDPFDQPVFHAVRFGTNEAGRFAVELPSEARFGDTFRLHVHDLELRDFGFAGSSAPTEVTAEAPQELGELVLTLGASGVAGRCVDPGGRPVSGLALAAQGFETSTLRAWSDEQGRFAFRGFLPARVELAPVGREWVLLQAPLLAAFGDQDVEVVVVQAGAIAGSVRLGDGSKSLGLRHTVERMEAPGVPVRDVSGERDGTFAIEGLAPGRYRYRLVSFYEPPDSNLEPKPKLLLEVEDLTVVSGATTRDPRMVDIDLREHLQHAVLKVVDGSGKPLHAQIFVSRADGERETVWLGTYGSYVVFDTDLSSASAVVSANGYRSRRIEPVTSQTVVLEPGFEVRLRFPDVAVDEPERFFLKMAGGLPDVESGPLPLYTTFAPPFFGRDYPMRLPGPGTYSMTLVIAEGPSRRLPDLVLEERDAGGEVWVDLPEALVGDLPPRRIVEQR